MRTTIRSDEHFVPPVTDERSPPDLADDRRGLAGDRRFVDRGDALDDLAVAGDQLVRPRPRRGRPCGARDAGHRPPAGPCPRRASRATVSWRILRSVSACALPRPSATASAKFAKSTVNHSHSVIAIENHSGRRARRRGDEVAHARARSSARCRPRRRTSPGSCRARADRASRSCRAIAARRIAGIEQRDFGLRLRHQQHLVGAASGSARRSGPSDSAGKNVSAPTITITPTSSAVKAQPSVGNVPEPGLDGLLVRPSSRRSPAPARS